MGIDNKTLAAAKLYVKQSLQGAGALKGKPGSDGVSPTISENPNNSSDIYKLDITDKNGKFTTPNLIGIINAKYENIAAGTPVGEIISYMGTISPPNYLICDGAEYQISDFPYLTHHFIENFGTVNYFGGDGKLTFAVPDLRGEFLRGMGGKRA